MTQKKSYTKTWTQRHLMWTGAKYTTSELVSNITQLESQGGVSSLGRSLTESSRSALSALLKSLRKRPQLFLLRTSARTGLGSPSASVWAKAPGCKAGFAEHETLGSADSKDYSEIRGAIAEVMRSSHHQGS